MRGPKTADVTLDAARLAAAEGTVLRAVVYVETTHSFVMPVFLEDLGAFRSTRFAIEQALEVHKAKPLSGQLEIETYTWDMLPAYLKTGDIVDYVCREIEWVRDQLVGARQPAAAAVATWRGFDMSVVRSVRL